MAIPAKHLGQGEEVMFHLRTHIKRILGWLLLGLLILVAAIVGSVLLTPLVPVESQTPVLIGIWLITLMVLIPVALVPWMRWVTSTYTITNRRIITRTGIFNKRGNDIPLIKISNVSYERSIVDRLFGCGTLILQTSAEVPLLLDDIPNVEHVHVRMTELLFHTANQAHTANRGE